METLVKNIVAGMLPHIIDYLKDNKHILVDFLREEAKKSDNALDDFIVDVIDEWID